MANILDILNQIGTAVYGRDVRQAIIDAIRQCYEDGKAGVNDLQARTLIEAVMTINEQQAAEIEALTARVEELEEGESGGSSETSTTSVPTFLVESGTTTFENVGANKTATQSITFTENFTEAPTVLAIKVFRQGANTFYSQVTAQPIQSSITTTGFTLAVGNKYTQAVSPSVLWVAFQPTTVEVETEITTVDGMTEADVRALLAPITAALDSLKIGYDGTEYDTAGGSLRDQINALHVLIGDEPGTAISASAVAYGEDSDVETALDAVNGRLQQQEEAVFSQFAPLLDIWETGIIDASGALGNNSHRFRMKQIMTYPYDMEISVDDGYIGYICFYDGTDAFAFRSQGFNHYAVPKNTKFRAWVMKSDDSADDGYKHVKFSTVAYAGYLRSNYKDDELSAEFVAVYRQGGLSSSGAYSSNYARIMTPNVYTLEQESEVTIKSGFAIDFQTFSGDTFVSRTGWLKDSAVIPAGTYKFTIAKSPEDQSVMADVVEFSSAVMFTALGGDNDMKTINGQSFDFGIKYPASFVVESLLDDLATMTANVGKVTDEFAICYQRKPKSYLIENDGTATSEIRFTLNNAIAYDGIQEFTIALYIPDASNIDHLRFDCMSTTWKKTVNATFVDGWNFIRVNTNGTDMGVNATEYRFRLFVYYTDNSIISPVYLGEINAVKPPHASLIFVDDGPYGSFLDLAYPVLTSIGCPVTWAIECASLGETRVGNRSLISLSELTALEEDGISEFSWHGYNGEKTVNLDAADTAKANLKAIRFLARRGDITGKIFRAVWPGNTAPNYQLAVEDLDACGTYNGAHGYCLYPYEDKYNLPRNSLQTRDTAYIDDMFDYLKHTHTVCYVYTHGIIDSTSFDPNEQDMRLDLLQYFAVKIQAGINEGWLKATTFNRLEREYWG